MRQNLHGGAAWRTDDQSGCIMSMGIVCLTSKLKARELDLLITRCVLYDTNWVRWLIVEQRERTCYVNKDMT